MTSGVSAGAQYSTSQAHEAESHLRESFTLGNGIRRAMDELVEEFDQCRHANWDGYGAEPITLDTYRAAYSFLEALPAGTEAPEVCAEPDGHLSLEWHRAPRRSLTVSISADGDLHYAALLGPNKTYGTEVFLGDLPEPILDLIERATETT